MLAEGGVQLGDGDFCEGILFTENTARLRRQNNSEAKENHTKVHYIAACACHRQRGNSKSTTLLLPIKMFWLRKIKARIKTEEIRRDRTSKTGKQRISSMLFHRTLDGGYDRSKVILMSLSNFSTWDFAFNHLTCFGDRFVCTIALN